MLKTMPRGPGMGMELGAGLHFVLVHGFCGGSWCWYKLKCLLESSGHRTTSLDLRASGTDPTDVSSVLTFDDYNLPLDRFFASLPDGQKVILVGHSAGGLSVTNALRKFPHKIHVAVYVAATMLQFGYRTPHDLQIVEQGYANFTVALLRRYFLIKKIKFCLDKIRLKDAGIELEAHAQIHEPLMCFQLFEEFVKLFEGVTRGTLAS